MLTRRPNFVYTNRQFVQWNCRGTSRPTPTPTPRPGGGGFTGRNLWGRVRKELDKDIELGDLPQEVVEQVLPVITAEKAEYRGETLNNLLTEQVVQEAKVDAADIERAVKEYITRQRRIRQLMEDDEIMLLH